MFIGKSKIYRNILKEIGRISALSCDVLIIGEPGTGKGVIAEKIHDESGPSGDALPFIRVKLSHMKEKELSAILCNLRDNAEKPTELFPRGVTGFSKGTTIVIEQVETAGYQNQQQLVDFLNELTDLRSLQNGHKLNTRVIVTITEAPSLLADKKEITEALAQYLNTFTRLFIPPLRDRKEDIPLLVEHLIADGKTINGSLDTIERNIIDSALKKFEYNISKTAEFLEMSSEHLEYRAHELGLKHKK